jgi:cell division transport system permease protein
MPQYLRYILGQAWQGFWRNPVMSIASTATVAGMLLLSSFFVIAQRGLDVSLNFLQSKVELYLELDDNAKPSEILALKTRIEGNSAVDHVVYVSKDEALARLKEVADKTGQVSLADVSVNPLPASLEVKMRDAQQTTQLASMLRDEVGKGIVTDVVDNPSVVDKVLTITRVLSIGGLAVLALMLFVTLFVIVNTIRIAVHARRDEIEIMQLVGATDSFVRWPFIIEGVLVGLFGATIALAALAAAAPPVMSAISGFLTIVPIDFGALFAAELGAAVLCFALLIGAGGALISVRSYLR